MKTKPVLAVMPRISRPDGRQSLEVTPSVSRREALAFLASSALVLPGTLRAASGPRDQIVALAAEPLGSVLYKATGRAVFRSPDGGRSWQDLGMPLRPGARIQSISVSAAGAAALYVAGSGIDIVRRTQDGAGWSRVGHALPRRISAVAAHARQEHTVYAYARGRGIYRSDDGGERWRLMDAGPRGGISQFVHSDMPGSMQTGWLFTAGPQGVRLAMDCFCGWRPSGDLAGGAVAVVYDRRNSSRLATATTSGVFESSDRAQSWARLANDPVKVTALAFAADGSLLAASGARIYRWATARWEAVDA